MLKLFSILPETDLPRVAPQGSCLLLQGHNSAGCMRRQLGGGNRVGRGGRHDTQPPLSPSAGRPPVCCPQWDECEVCASHLWPQDASGKAGRDLNKAAFLTVPTTPGSPAALLQPTLSTVLFLLQRHGFGSYNSHIHNYFARLPPFLPRNTNERKKLHLSAMHDRKIREIHGLPPVPVVDREKKTSLTNS